MPESRPNRERLVCCTTCSVVVRYKTSVTVSRAVPNIKSDRPAETRDFFLDLLGFEVAMDMGWVMTVTSPTNPSAQVTIIGNDDMAAPGISVEVPDVDAVHARAVERGLEIAYSLRDEEWGVRRFMIREPSGTLINVVSHGSAARPARGAVRPAARQPVTGNEGHHDSHINHHRDGRYTMNAPTSITITPVFVADLSVEGERMPVYVHVIDHPDARVLVDTGMTELHPAMADMDPRLQPLSEQDFDLAGIDIVVNTHLHADHCGGNHLFAGKPIYVQRRELDDARSEGDYIREWVEAPGVRYVPVDGELELLPGSDSSRRRATHAACRWSSSRLAGARSSSAGTWRCGSASSTSRPPKAGSGSLRSTPSSSGSRTSTSHGDPAPSEASRRRSLSRRVACNEESCRRRPIQRRRNQKTALRRRAVSPGHRTAGDLESPRGEGCPLSKSTLPPELGVLQAAERNSSSRTRMRSLVRTGEPGRG